MIKIGIDPSTTSTGVCVWDEIKNKNIYHVIPSKMTKKMELFDNKYITLHPYYK